VDAAALIGRVGIVDRGVADIVGVFGKVEGFTFPALQLDIGVHGGTFEDVAVIEQRYPGIINGLLVDFAGRKPVVNRFKVF